MIMMTIALHQDERATKPQVPFHTVYMTGLIRDDEGRRCQIRKGNVIDRWIWWTASPAGTAGNAPAI